MKIKTFISVNLLLVFVIFGTAAASADVENRLTADASADPERPKIGLVLSGGGAKGIAHVGVLKVLEEAGIQVDYISGTSMGSIVGALYSIGYSTDELLELALTSDWENLFTDRPGRQHLSMYEKRTDERFILSFPISDRGINLPSGLVAGQNIFSWLTRYTWPVLDVEDFSDLPIPYATVATDLETGEAVVFNSGYLPDAIRASISFPTALNPYEIDGRRLIDGGLIRNLPVQEVLDMGADYVIAVDASSQLRSSDELNSIISILNQAVYFRIIEKMNEQKDLADFVIQITDLDEYTVTDFDEAELFIEFGENTARTYMDKLLEIADKQGAGGTEPRTLSMQESILISELSVTGNVDVPGDLILTEMAHLEGTQVSASDIERSIDQLYGTRLFNLITYRVHDLGEERYRLEFRVIENIDDSFRVGVRYESDTQASILLHTSFRNLFHRGSTFQMNLRLGRDNHVSADYLLMGGPRSRFGIHSRLVYNREEVDHYEGGNRISSLTSHQLSADLFSGTLLHRDYTLGAGLRGSINSFSQQINPGGIPYSEEDYQAVYGRFLIDTFNRRSYPVNGQKLLFEGYWSDQAFKSPINFNMQRFYLQSWHPLLDWLSLQHTVYLGRSHGDQLPWKYWFSPNRHDEILGTVRFGGYDRYELTGRNIQMVSAGFQFEPWRHRFIRIDAYLGNSFEEFSFNLPDNRYKTGFSLSLGALTILGPLELILSGSSQNRFLYELQVGFEF